MAAAIGSGTAPSLGASLVALRPALVGVEQALKDADREHAARLWRHAIPPAVPRTLWRQDHPTGRPSLFGHRFNFTPAGNRFGLPAYYSLHAWVWDKNPAGQFQMWNPRVHCPSGI